MQCLVIWDQSEGKFIRLNASAIRMHEPDETDNEFRTDVIAIEFISQSGDHILIYIYSCIYAFQLCVCTFDFRFVSFCLEFTRNCNS